MPIERHEDPLEFIRKLVEREQGERALGNLKAAEAFAAKIREQLLKYKLSLSDVERAREAKANPMTYAFFTADLWGSHYKPDRELWTEELADVVARAHFCRSLVLTGDIKNNSIGFVGTKKDIEVARYVFCRLARTAIKLCKDQITQLEGALQTRLKEAREHPGRFIPMPYSIPKNFAGSFFIGFTHAIHERYKRQKVELQLTEGETTALMRLDTLVDNYTREIVDGRVDSDAPPVDELDYNAYFEGRRQGAQVKLEADGLESGDAPDVPALNPKPIGD